MANGFLDSAGSKGHICKDSFCSMINLPHVALGICCAQTFMEMKKNAAMQKKHMVSKKKRRKMAPRRGGEVFKNPHLVSFARFVVSVGFSWFRLVSFGLGSFQMVSIGSGGLGWFLLV